MEKDCSICKYCDIDYDFDEEEGEEYPVYECQKENGGKQAMKERVKIITDGEKAEVYIDGKKVKCTDMELHFIGHVDSKPMIKVEAQWHKEDENGNVILNEYKTEVLTDGIKINC